jgi:hypothetical protein
LPPDVAKAFARDMKAYFKATGQNKRDEIAARQRSALSEFQGPRDKKLRVTDVIKMFNEMKDQL